jgi:hypothetical protein
LFSVHEELSTLKQTMTTIVEAVQTMQASMEGVNALKELLLRVTSQQEELQVVDSLPLDIIKKEAKNMINREIEKRMFFTEEGLASVAKNSFRHYKLIGNAWSLLRNVVSIPLVRFHCSRFVLMSFDCQMLRKAKDHLSMTNSDLRKFVKKAFTESPLLTIATEQGLWEAKEEIERFAQEIRAFPALQKLEAPQLAEYLAERVAFATVCSRILGMRHLMNTSDSPLPFKYLIRPDGRVFLQTRPENKQVKSVEEVCGLNKTDWRFEFLLQVPSYEDLVVPRNPGAPPRKRKESSSASRPKTKAKAKARRLEAEDETENEYD